MKELIKIIINYFIKIILIPLYAFPMNSKRVVLMSYSGLQYSCNPKYISDFLLENYSSYKLIWVFKNIEKHKIDPSIIKVKYLSLKYFYYVITSRYCISNTGFNRFFFIRNGQRFVQTWHGGGAYKRRFLNQDKNFFNKILDAQHDNMITDFISSSEFFTKYFIKDSVYKGKILNIGMPRNSYLLRNADNKKVLDKKRLNLTNFLKCKSLDNKCIVLYAPTWRDDGSTYNFPKFDEILETIKLKFNKEPILLLRGHHFQALKNNLSGYFYDVKDYPDMQELLLISDILISDYSSSIWDFSLLKKPCFLYTPDLKHYEDMRGFYVPSSSWGFDICKNSEELKGKIVNFELSDYIEKISTMHKKFGSFENEYSNELLMEVLGISK